MSAEIVSGVVGIISGVLIGWTWAWTRGRALQSVAAELRAQIGNQANELAALRAALAQEQKGRVAAETRLEEAQHALAREQARFNEAAVKMGDMFSALSIEALQKNNRLFLDLAQRTFENQMEVARGDISRRQEAIEGLIKPIKESLERYQAGIHTLEQARQEAYGGLMRHLQDLTLTHQQLHRETAHLVQALRTPQVRGRWGEVTLRRVVEAAGMSAYCDFCEQPVVESGDKRLRPDLIVRLPGGRTVAVDAKVPLQSYLDAVETVDDDAKHTALAGHARAVREHIRVLGGKEYWRRFNGGLDFVVLFLPGESFFSAALEQDRDLIEDGISNRVVIATPTTLIALLRTVAYTWQQEQVAENAECIAREGGALYERLVVFTEHLGRLRDGLSKVVESYNKAVGSWDSRVMPGARRLKELGAGALEKDPDIPQPVEKALRLVTDNTDANGSF